MRNIYLFIHTYQGKLPGYPVGDSYNLYIYTRGSATKTQTMPCLYRFIQQKRPRISGFFAHKRPGIEGSFAQRDLQLEAFYAYLPPLYRGV